MAAALPDPPSGFVPAQPALVGRELVDAWNAHDSGRLTMIHSPTFLGVDVAAAVPVRGRDGVQLASEMYLRAFPDLHLSVEETIVEEDRLVLVWTAEGTHKGAFLNIPATQRRLNVRGISTLNVADNLIERSTCVWDVAGLLRGLKLLPDL